MQIPFLTDTKGRSAFDLLDESLRKKRIIVAAGYCRVDYQGRASSTLDWGDRVLIIKTRH